MKNFILIIVPVVIGLGIYYSGVYTYFLENKISEEMPEIKIEASAHPTASPGASPEVTSAPPVLIKIIKQGNFINADFFHKGSGQAKIFEYPDGRKILRFENFETINGPDLFVYLSVTDSPSGNLNSLGDYLDLGRLKGNIGNQNYDLPANTKLSRYNSAIIWCKKFGVLFPYAVLK